MRKSAVGESHVFGVDARYHVLDLPMEVRLWMFHKD